MPSVSRGTEVLDCFVREQQNGKTVPHVSASRELRVTVRQAWISVLADQWCNPTVAKQEDWSKSSGRKTGSDNSPVVIRQACCEEGGLRSSQDLKLMDQDQ